MAQFHPNFYTHTIGGQKADFYRICLTYGITDPALAHALKKLLRAGRSHKSLEQDVQDCIDTLRRWQDIQREDAPQGIAIMVNQEPLSPVEKGFVEAEEEVFFQFLPVKPEWHREHLENLDSWDGPGWYAIETNPFCNAFLVGPFITRALAMAGAKEKDKGWTYQMQFPNPPIPPGEYNIEIHDITTGDDGRPVIVLRPYTTNSDDGK